MRWKRYLLDHTQTVLPIRIDQHWRLKSYNLSKTICSTNFTGYKAHTCCKDHKGGWYNSLILALIRLWHIITLTTMNKLPKKGHSPIPWYPWTLQLLPLDVILIPRQYGNLDFGVWYRTLISFVFCSSSQYFVIFPKIAKAHTCQYIQKLVSIFYTWILI